MIIPQQSALASREKIQGDLKRMWKENNLLYLSGIGLIGLLTTSLISWKYDISPELTVASGLGAAGCFAWSLIELARMVKITQSTSEETARWLEIGGFSAIIAPLSERLPLDEKRQLTALEAPMAQLQLLQSGQLDPDPTDLEVPQSDELSALAGGRIKALEVILSTLIDPRVKSISLRGPEERTEILEQLKRVLAAPPNSLGLSLTGPEAHILAMEINIGAMTERAPKTMVKYLQLLRALIVSYVLNEKITPRGKAMVDDLMTAAVRAGFFTGVAASPPVEEWKRAKELTDTEEEKVVLTEHQVIAFAKSLVALGNNRAPEVRKVFVGIVPGVKKLLIKEQDRLERLNQSSAEPNIKLAVINTVLAILDISIDRLVNKRTIDTLNQLFGNRLSGKTRITPRDLMEEFENTGFGSLSIEGDRIIVMAQNINLADVLACAAVICHPHVPRIEIYISKDNKVAEQSIMTPTGVFYSLRLILGERQFISEQLKQQSSQTEPIPSSPAPVLLAEVSVQSES